MDCRIVLAALLCACAPGLPDPGRFVPVEQQLLEDACADPPAIASSYFIGHEEQPHTLRLKAGTGSATVPCASTETGFRCTFDHTTETLPDFDATITTEEQAELWFESSDAAELVHSLRTRCRGADCSYLAGPFERAFEHPLPCDSTRWLRIVRR